ncbi:hypothetical protein CBR_g30077 [Chara braunii]|uniref:Uncharacterized protein n=1 Tax=Chara braunii TaxID=69332 RepID=A0A388LC01_CHABU|nr:hypothetical protein CBR_g30077 [Chara braunii]|eukprot:GBG79814.1 hypothetical protein CBR_g30077 [Chara braunii]
MMLSCFPTDDAAARSARIIMAEASGWDRDGDGFGNGAPVSDYCQQHFPPGDLRRGAAHQHAAVAAAQRRDVRESFLLLPRLQALPQRNRAMHPAVCDGVVDCADGSDEDTSACATFDCAAAGRYRCPSGKYCMNVTNIWGAWRHAYRDPYKYYLCDGVSDCKDGSDEDPSFCAHYNCVGAVPHTPVPMTLYWSDPRDRRLRCPTEGGSAKSVAAAVDVCVFANELCDGVAQCPHAADESDALCKRRGCSRAAGRISNLFQCARGRCIAKERQCDGQPDCPDRDDEGDWCARTTCWGAGVKCPGDNKTCIPTSRMCDGVPDCADGSDEQGGCDAYECWNNRCPSGRCATSWMTLCDGIKQCTDGSDEDPAFCRTYNCTDYEEKCKDGLQCVAKPLLCDTVPHCADASDEDPIAWRSRKTCGVQCPGRAKTCISKFEVCDGTPQCLDGSDESPSFCSTDEARRIAESSYRIRCRNNKTRATYVDGSYCDGMSDCPDGSDESRPFFPCRPHTCQEERVKCYGTWCVYGRLCDGIRDCPNGSDEANYAAPRTAGRPKPPPWVPSGPTTRTPQCYPRPGRSFLDCQRGGY